MFLLLLISLFGSDALRSWLFTLDRTWSLKSLFTWSYHLSLACWTNLGHWFGENRDLDERVQLLFVWIKVFFFILLLCIIMLRQSFLCLWQFQGLRFERRSICKEFLCHSQRLNILVILIWRSFDPRDSTISSNTWSLRKLWLIKTLLLF